MQWLVPHYVRDGLLHMGIYSFLVETPDRKIVVDTAVGNGKTRAGPTFNMLDTDYFENFQICLAARRCRRCRLYPFACRPCRLEYPSGQWQVGADFSERHLLLRRPRIPPLGAAIEDLHPMFDATAVFSDSVRPIVDAGLAYLCRTVGPPDAGSRVDPVARPYPWPRLGAHRVERRQRGDHRRPHAHPVPDRPAGLVEHVRHRPGRRRDHPAGLSGAFRGHLDDGDRHPFRHPERLCRSPRRVHLPAVACGLAIRWSA